jgi:N-acetyl-gamma-glutamylphosphate reductase
LTEPVTVDEMLQRFRAVYDNEALVCVTESIPELRELADGGIPKAGLAVGGFAVDERDAHRATLVVVLDNLLKGAAGQALQNLNVSLGLDEHLGLGDLT